MSTPLQTSQLNLADYVAKGVWAKENNNGIINRLAPETEFLYGNTDLYTFTGTPKAQLVGEGANKTSDTPAPSKVVAKTYKLQITRRMSQEVLNADEDHQLRYVDLLIKDCMKALDRAIDLVSFHGINPMTGEVDESVLNYIAKSENGVEHIDSTDNAAADIRNLAAKLQGNGYNASAIALDPVYAGTLARLTKTDGSQMFPELGLGFNVNSFGGLRAAVSNTVSASKEIASPIAGGKRIQAIMADWDAFKWGVREIVPLERIDYGNPDGAGDLKQMNQVAFRAEIYLAFAILDGKAFAVIDKAEA